MKLCVDLSYSRVTNRSPEAMHKGISTIIERLMKAKLPLPLFIVNNNEGLNPVFTQPLDGTYWSTYEDHDQPVLPIVPYGYDVNAPYILDCSKSELVTYKGIKNVSVDSVTLYSELDHELCKGVLIPYTYAQAIKEVNKECIVICNNIASVLYDKEEAMLTDTPIVEPHAQYLEERTINVLEHVDFILTQPDDCHSNSSLLFHIVEFTKQLNLIEVAILEKRGNK